MSTFPNNLFACERFSVVGLGRNGLPAATALAAMGATVTAWDDNAAARDVAAAAGITLADPCAGDLALDAMVLSPGIPHILPKPHPAAARALAAGVPILTDVELLYRAVRKAGSRARFAGITGTNGKSTTTALLAHILAESGVPMAAGANLGTAALSLPLLPDHGVYVLEMSSYMLERIATVRFDVAVMLNLSADHIDRHGDMAGYARAKRAIFARQFAEDTAVIGIDDGLSRAMADELALAPARLVRVSGEVSSAVTGAGGILHDAFGPLMDLGAAPTLPGSHNWQNAAAATAMAQALGVARGDIARHIPSYPGLPHRQQKVAEIDGIAFINDSKATNADASARALGCYDKLVWIAGGMAKEGGIEPLAAYFPRIAHALLIGRDAPQLAATLTARNVPHTLVETLENAAPAALQAARTTGANVVLLSPACASFDQFSGFDARGTRFAELAARLGAN